MASSKSMKPLTESFFPTIFYRNQFQAKAPGIPSHLKLQGQTALVTGANVGLGLECSRQLLDLHLSHLILAVRSIDKGEIAATTLRKDFPDAKIEIHAFATRAEKELDRLDMAILNAGLMTLKFSKVEETNHELMMQVNYLSNALLSLLLLPVLRRGAKEGRPGRLTIINAALSLVARPPFLDKNVQDDNMLPSFDDPKAFQAGEWYNSSKLMMHMFVWKLSELVPADEVTINLVVLGYIKGTQLARGVPTIVRPLVKIFEALLARSLRDGASTYVDAAVTKGKESHGCCLMSWKVQPYATLLYSSHGATMIEKLWRETIGEVGHLGVDRLKA